MIPFGTDVYKANKLNLEIIIINWLKYNYVKIRITSHPHVHI